MKLPQVLSNLCRERGWSLARLAREAGVPHQTVHSWTVGRISINPDQLRRVAEALQVSVHFLMFGEGDPFEQPGTEILREIFSGDVRVTLHRIERTRPTQRRKS
jgi:transcriptional regulator with XRE-family HTH domain